MVIVHDVSIGVKSSGVEEKSQINKQRKTWTNSWFSFFLILCLAGYTCLQWERPADAESQSKEGDRWWS